jgi:hypothetical protein
MSFWKKLEEKAGTLGMVASITATVLTIVHVIKEEKK